MSYTKPMIRVFQKLESAPNLTSRNLRACLIGPRYDLLRYDNPDEKENGFLGNYAGALQADIPGLGGNSKALPATARVHIENAWVDYSIPQTPMSADVYVLAQDDLSDINISEQYANHQHSVVFKDPSQFTDLLHRDIQVGDTLRVDASTYAPEDAETPYVAQGTVVGLLHNVTADSAIEIPDLTTSPAFINQDVASSLAGSDDDISFTPECIANSLDLYDFIARANASDFKMYFPDISAVRDSSVLSADPGTEATVQTFGELQYSDGTTVPNVGPVQLTISYAVDSGSFSVSDVRLNIFSDDSPGSTILAGFYGSLYYAAWFDGTTGAYDIIAHFQLHLATDTLTDPDDYTNRKLQIGTVDYNEIDALVVTFNIKLLTPASGVLSTTIPLTAEVSSNDPDTYPTTVCNLVQLNTPYTDPDTGHTLYNVCRLASPYPGIPDFYLLGNIAAGNTLTVTIQNQSVGTEVSGVVLDSEIPYSTWFSAVANNQTSKSVKLSFFEVLDYVSVPPVDDFGGPSSTLWEVVDRREIKISALRIPRYGVSLPISSVEGDDDLNKLYMSYKAFNAENEGEVITIASVSDPRIGAIDPENPAGYGVFKAMMNSAGTPVSLAVTEDTVAGYAIALDTLTTEGDIQALAPLTSSAVLHAMVVYHTLQMSTENMNRWRRAWVAEDIGTQSPILSSNPDGSTLLGRIVVDGETGENRLQLATGSRATFKQVKAGDTLRFEYGHDAYGEETYRTATVIRVLGPNVLVLDLDLGYTQSADYAIELWRDTTSSIYIDRVGGRAEGYDTRRVSLVTPSLVEDLEGRFVPGYYLAAGMAGLASGVPPHQSLTNSKVAGFNSVQYAPFSKLTSDDLDELAGKGVCILTGKGGNITIRHCVTTDTATVKTREEMFTRNLDSISYTYWDAISPYVGRCNVYPEFLAKLRTDLEAVKGYIISSSARPDIGSQMIDCKVVSVAQDPVLRDKVRMDLRPDLPFPFNNGDISLWL